MTKNHQKCGLKAGFKKVLRASVKLLVYEALRTCAVSTTPSDAATSNSLATPPIALDSVHRAVSHSRVSEASASQISPLLLSSLPKAYEAAGSKERRCLFALIPHLLGDVAHDWRFEHRRQSQPA